MKCSIVARASWSKSHKVLTVGSANLFLDIKGIEDGAVVVPVQLKYVRQDNGKFGKPFIDVRQPQYQAKSGKNAGKWLISYLTVHLNGAAAKFIEKVCDADFLKPAIARIQKSKVASDYEFEKGSWKHIGDRELTQTDSPEDEALLQNAVGAADEFAARAESASVATAAAAEVEGDQAVADEVLGQ